MIGVFDSGIGGITVLKALHRLMPHVQMIYVADFDYCPYGNRHEKDIIERSYTIMHWLKKQGASLIVAACHTSSSILTWDTSDIMQMPVISMIDPTIECVLKKSHEEKWQTGIGLIGTERTIERGVLVKKIKENGFLLPIYSLACPKLAPLIESCQWLEAQEYMYRHVLPFLQSHSMDAFIYGCTHYPYIERWIEADSAFPTRLDPADAVAMHVQKIMQQTINRSIPKIDAHPITLYYTGQEDKNRLKMH